MKTKSVTFINSNNINRKNNKSPFITSLYVFFSVHCIKNVKTRVKSFMFFVQGENSYNCNGTKYGQVTRTKVINPCNTQTCSELTPTSSISIKGKLVSQKNVGWLEQLKGTVVIISGITRVPCAQGQKGILHPCFHSEFCTNYKNGNEIWCFIRVANESRFEKEQRRRKINKARNQEQSRDQ